MRIKTILQLSFLCLVYISFSCKKSPEPVNYIDFVSLPKLDSISTSAFGVDQANCNPYSSTMFEANYKFTYDDKGRIAFIKRTAFGYAYPFATFNFFYNANDKVAKIISVPSSGMDLKDSILFYYQGNDLTEVRNYILYQNGSAVLKSYTHKFQKLSEKLKITVLQNSGFVYDTLFRADSDYDNAGNVSKAVYFRSYPFPASDTSTTLENSYYTNIANPYYSIQGRINFPFFFIVRYGGLNNGNNIVDLTQALSKNVLRSTVYKFFPASSCGTSSSAVPISATFPLSTYNLNSASNVTSINQQLFMQTLSGFINFQSAFWYQ